MTGEDGRFSFFVPEGEWILHAQTEWERIPGTKEDRQLIANRTLNVEREDVDGLTLQLSATFTLTASAEIEGEKEAPRFVPPLLLTPDDPALGPAFGRPGDPRSGVPGTLAFEHLSSGSYKVATAGLPGADGLYLAAFYVGGQNVMGQPFPVSPGTIGLRAIFKRARGGVRGTTDGGKPGIVLVIPAPGSANDVIASVETKRDRPFVVNGLAPGDYEVIALDRVDAPRLMDKAFVSGLAAGATRVRVEDAVVSCTLRVNAWPE